MILTNNIHSKLDDYFTIKGLTSYKVAQITDISEVSIGRYRKGTSKPNNTNLSILLEKFPDLQEFLMGGVFKKEVSQVSENDYMMVEYADLETSAGDLGKYPIEQLPETHKRLIPREYDKGLYLVVRVHGDSMDDGSKRALCNGDEVLIKKIELINGDTLPFRNFLFVISSNEGDVIKQIVNHDTEKGFITCHSFNPSWKDYDILLENVYSIFTVEKIVKRKPIF